MNKYLLLVFLLVGFNSKPFAQAVIDKLEALNAFQYLSEIRANPSAYASKLGYESSIKVSRIQLSWNDTLVAVAEAKALDMANRNYNDHTDPNGYGINYFISKAGYWLNPNWLQKKDMNYFESIAAGTLDGKNCIEVLIRDKDVPSLGHRKHVLGLDVWNATLRDIGIGFARRQSGSFFQTYVCVIIAKHDW